MTTTTLSLATFLLARLADDEADARYAIEAADHYGKTWGDAVDAMHSFGFGIYVTAHIARHDPARVLADVEAKRAIVALHGSAQVYGYLGTVEDACTQCGSLTATSAAGDSDYEPWPCQTLRLLAQPYRDHPAYRAEWDA